jgi:hypothetical protein
MGANSQQGWALLLFVAGFTFFIGGFVALGPIFTIAGAVGLIASSVWFHSLKPLEHDEPETAPHAVPTKKAM